jgi:ribosomal subunit interface protein
VDVRITSRHAHLGEKVRTYALEKLGPLSRYYDRTSQLEVVFDERPLGWNIEVIAHIARGEPIVATIQHKELTAAIDLAHDKLERLLSREKDRRRSHRREGRGKAPAAGSDGASKPSGNEEE